MFIESIPEISVIVLTYKRENGFKKAIDSLYSQNFKNFEVIVIDNGNSKNYFQNISNYLISKHNFRYIKFDENTEFIGKRLNQAISISKGKYISFLMDDDILLKDSLSGLHEEISSKNLDFVYGKVKTIDHSTGKVVSNRYSSKDWENIPIRGINPIHITSVLVKKDIFNKIGGFNEELKRSYDLDLWARVFSIARSKRIHKTISCVSTNNLDSVTGKNPLEKILLLKKNPLQGYWFNRKCVSFPEVDYFFKSYFNDRNYPYVITDNFYQNADILISGNKKNINNFGLNFYYGLSEAKDFDGFISPVHCPSKKLKHILRPMIFLDQIIKMDQIPYILGRNLKIVCKKIDNKNVDIICDILKKLSDKFSAVFVYLNSDLEIIKRVGGIPNVIPLSYKSILDLKKQSVDVVLYLDFNNNNYEEAYDSFLLSSLIKSPLVSTPSIAYEDILERSLDLYIEESPQKIVNSILKAKDIYLRESIITNMRYKTFLYFLDKVVLDKFVLFLNDHIEDTLNIQKGEILLSQLNSNSSILIKSSLTITQEFKISSDKFNCIQFFGKVTNNLGGFLYLAVQQDKEIEKVKIPSFSLKNGVNTVLLKDIPVSHNQNFSFTVSVSDDFFEMDITNFILNHGIMYINNVPKKSCVKFKVLKV